MKLRVASWRIIWRFLLTVLVVYIISFGVFSSFFITYDQEIGGLRWVEWDYRQPFLLIFLFLLGVGTLIPTLLSYYYIVEDKYFIMKRYGKEFVFDYANIEFIDIEESKKKKKIIFYSTKARMRYMLGDKEGKVLETLIKKCPNTLTVEEFRRKHPEEKY